MQIHFPYSHFTRFPKTFHAAGYSESLKNRFFILKLFNLLIRITTTTKKCDCFGITERMVFMDGFFQTPMTRFYVEAIQSMGSGKGTAAGGQTGTVDVPSVQASKDGLGGFAGTVQDKLDGKEQQAAGISPQAAGGVSSTGRNEQAIQSMSMKEYKLYIYQRISALPRNLTQKGDVISVNISEEGFAAMKADPAYEKWVLDTLRNDFSCYQPWNAYTGGSYRFYSFGADRKEYRSESYSMGFRNDDRRKDSGRKKKEKSFWEKRAERHKLYMDLAQKAWYKRENERRFQERIDFGRKEVSSAILKQHAIERATGEHVELDANPSILSEAATESAQEYVFFKIPSALVNPKPKTGK